MQYETLERITGMLLEAPASLWARAYLVGHARWRSNEERRNARRSRATAGNIVIDVRGAFGELLLLDRLLRGAADGGPLPGAEAAAAYLRAHMFTEGGGGDEAAQVPDLQFLAEQTGVRYGVDVKSFNCDVPKNRRFLINDAAHRKLAGRCDAYMCLLVPTLGWAVGITRLVPYAAVGGWAVTLLPPHSDPARTLPLADFATHYVPPDWQPNRRAFTSEWALYGSLAVKRYTWLEVEALVRDQVVRDSVTKEFPSIRPEWLPRENCTLRGGAPCVWCAAVARDPGLFDPKSRELQGRREPPASVLTHVQRQGSVSASAAAPPESPIGGLGLPFSNAGAVTHAEVSPTWAGAVARDSGEEIDVGAALSAEWDEALDGEPLDEEDDPAFFADSYAGRQYMRAPLDVAWAKALARRGARFSYGWHGEVGLLGFRLPESGQYLALSVSGSDADVAAARVVARRAPLQRGRIAEIGLDELQRDAPVALALPDGRFWLVHRDGEVTRTDDPTLFTCTECFGVWFGRQSGWWACRCCGAYDGDKYVAAMEVERLESWP